MRTRRKNASSSSAKNRLYLVLSRFQSVSCQLEMLRNAGPKPDVRAILQDIPKTLDETYERILKKINEKDRNHACRLLHCLAVAVRPLRVEELAEILTFDFDGAQGGIPKFRADWRPIDKEATVLSMCSTLISIVDQEGDRLVQFSYPSVKELLTSTHPASLTGDLSQFHILPANAHTILAQASLGFLLHLGDRNDDTSVKNSPLAEYAARHWVTHAQFEGVALRVMDGIKSLFDQDRPHFAAWIELYDIDAESGRKLPSETPSPLYYSALCGFHDLVRHLAVRNPQHVNAIGGSYGFPLVAALCRSHLRAAELLLEHGANVHVRDTKKQTALHMAIDRHENVSTDSFQFLLKRGVDVNAQRDDLWTPLHVASYFGKPAIAEILLDHGANASAETDNGETPLHVVSIARGESDSEDNGATKGRV